MDISPKGKRTVILTNKNLAYEYIRMNYELWDQSFSREPKLIKVPTQKQGEAICYGQDEKTLYLVSEHVSQPLWEISAC